MKNKEAWLISLFFSIGCLVYLSPIFSNFSYWGQYEWDQYLFFSAVQRKTILFFREFPLWNIFSNGGNLILAHPYSFFLSPIFLPILAFGVVAGVKIGILIFAVAGASGIYFLCRYLNIGLPGSLLSGFIYIFNGYFALRIKIGQIAEFSNMCIFPWFFYFYLKSFENKKYIVISMVVLAFLFLGGSTDILGGTAMFLLIFTFFISLIERKIFYTKLFFIVFLGAVCLGAVKIIPSSKFILGNLKPENFSITIPLNVLPTVLFGREHLNYEQSLIGYWTECGSYVGLGAFLLFIIGCISRNKARVSFLLTGVFFLLLVLKGPLNLWQAVRKMPFYCFQYSTCRYIIFFIFVLSILAGFGLSYIGKKLDTSLLLQKNTPLKARRITKKKNIGRLVELFFCFFVAGDLLIVNGSIIKDVFIAPPAKIKEGSGFVQRQANTNFLFERSAMYPVFLMNNGIVDSYERLGLKRGGILTKPYENSVPVRWKVFDCVLKADKGAVYSQIEEMENKHREREDSEKFDWKVVEPIQGLDGRHLAHRFSLLNPEGPYFDVVPSGRNSLWHVFYVLFYVYSPDELKGVSMETGGASNIQVWLNDRSIFSGEGDILRRKGNKLYFNLKAGWNKMLLRGVEIVGGFKDSMLGLTRIDRDGKALHDISYDALRQYLPYQEIEYSYRGEAYLENGRGVINFVRFSPNKIKLRLAADNSDRIIINQNYHKGWRVSGNLKAEPYNGLISLKINKGFYDIDLYFLPTDFLIGLGVSFLTVLGLIFFSRTIKT